MLSERLQITLHKKKSCAMLSSYSWDDIPQLKTLCNVVQDVPDNTAQKNPVQFCLNTVGITLYRSKPCAILSEWLQTTLHKKNSCLIAENTMQCCPRGSRKLCIYEKCSIQCQLLMQYQSYAMLSQRLQATLHRKKFRQFRQCCLNNIWLLCLHMYISGP